MPFKNRATFCLVFRQPSENQIFSNLFILTFKSGQVWCLDPHHSFFAESHRAKSHQRDVILQAVWTNRMWVSVGSFPAFQREGECFVSRKEGGNYLLKVLLCHLCFPGPILSYFPLFFCKQKHSPSLRKASRSNPPPIFSNCTQNYITLVPLCLATFRRKTIVYYSHCIPSQPIN